MRPTDRSAALICLEQQEVALVRALVHNPLLLDGEAETVLRTAISLSRLHHLGTGHRQIDVESMVLPLRAETLRLLHEARLKPGKSPAAEKLRPIATVLHPLAARTLRQIHEYGGAQIPREDIDREIRQKKLVLALGGGGGVGYIYLGAFKLLEDMGLTPDLIAGTSIGAILGLVRARRPRFDSADFLRIARSLSWGRLFNVLSAKSRYGLPAALRFRLRASFSKYFRHPDGSAFTLADLSIPLITSVSGISAGVLPRPLEFYARLLDGVFGFPTPLLLARRIGRVLAALIELVQISERFQAIYLGLEAQTEKFDAIDAVGFSAALPGVVHYDLMRKDERMHQIMEALFTRRELFRLADGCLVDNVPARAAWRAVQEGRLGTRNALIMALDGFGPRLRTPMWLATQQLVAAQVQRGRQHAHLYQAFSGTLSPLEFVPSVASMVKMIERGKHELSRESKFIGHMMRPLAPLPTI